MNHYRVRIYTIVLLLAIAGCKENRSKVHQASNADTTLTDTLLQKIDEKDAAYSQWKNFYEEMYGGIRLKNFADYTTGQMELEAKEATLDKNFYKNYGSLLVYNADSSKFIDLFSYGYIVEADKTGKLVARKGEPDQEASIVDVKSNQRTRILFCGTVCNIESAMWINEELIALYGITSENADDIYTPVIWFINTTNHNIATYYYHESSELPAAGYLEKYMNDRGVELIAED